MEQFFAQKDKMLWEYGIMKLPETWHKVVEQKRCLFHYRGLECKSKKSRKTCSDRRIRSWSTEWSRAKAYRVLPRECTGHSKHLLPTTQEKTLYMDITRWSIPKSDWLYSLQPKMKVKVKSLSCVWLFETPWTVAHQAPPSIEFSRQEYWNGLPFPSVGNNKPGSWL